MSSNIILSRRLEGYLWASPKRLPPVPSQSTKHEQWVVGSRSAGEGEASKAELSTVRQPEFSTAL
eukprot:3169653-Pyramimonas_sp.AAC.1